VSLVLLFHAGSAWLPGGYLGVSVFFTLSGYLITGVLLAEHASTSRLGLGNFYARRARRLLPASLLCVLLVVIGRAAGLYESVPTLRRDGTGALFQVFNWLRLTGTSSYADLFSSARGLSVSPFEHYWSLSIEEQFYLIWPFTVVAMLLLASKRGWTLLRQAALLTASFAVLAPVIAAVFGPDAAYWATPARLAEILLGGLVAVWLSARPSVRNGASVLALPMVLIIVWLAHSLPTGRGAAYAGMLPAFAVLSATLIYALQAPGIVRSVLSRGALVAVGRVSYGLYLFHWPVFLAMRQRGWSLSSLRGFTLAMAITSAITVASYFLLELPVRRSSVGQRVSLLCGASAVAVALVVVAVAPAAVPFVHVNENVLHDASLQPSADLPSLRPVATSSTLPAAPAEFNLHPSLAPASSRPVRMLVVGDSTALYLGHGLAAWSLEHPQHALVSVLWCQGCGFVLDGTITSFEATSYMTQSNVIVKENLPVTIANVQPDVVVLMCTVDDVANRQWSAAEGVLTPADPRFRQHLVDAYREVTDSILGLGVPRVEWIIPPVPTLEWQEVEMRELARYELQHSVIRQVAREHGANVGVVDADRFLSLAGHADDAQWRPDGVHLTEQSAAWLAEQYVGPVVVADTLNNARSTK